MAKGEASLGNHDASKCLEWGYPVAALWQPDPKCCAVYEAAACQPGFAKVRGARCGARSWGISHRTLCKRRGASIRREPLLYRCPKGKDACRPVSIATAMMEMQWSNVSQQACMDGYQGILCDACSEGHTLDTVNNQCSECEFSPRWATVQL